MRTLPPTGQPTCPGHSQKGVILQLILCLSREGHRGQVWLCLLILGVLCRSTWAYSGPDPTDVQLCLDNLQQVIEKSDAMLYAPSVNEIKEDCSGLSLACYMLELLMVLTEEQVQDSDTDCIYSFNEELKASAEASTGSCPPCEATAVRNSTMFLHNLKRLLKKLTVLSKRSTM